MLILSRYLFLKVIHTRQAVIRRFYGVVKVEYFEIKKSEKDTSQPYYFVLCARNGEVIATSEMYASKQGAENGIRSVIQNAPNAEVRDSTVTKSGMQAALERAMQSK